MQDRWFPRSFDSAVVGLVVTRCMACTSLFSCLLSDWIVLLNLSCRFWAPRLEFRLAATGWLFQFLYNHMIISLFHQRRIRRPCLMAFCCIMVYEIFSTDWCFSPTVPSMNRTDVWDIGALSDHVAYSRASTFLYIIDITSVQWLVIPFSPMMVWHEPFDAPLQWCYVLLLVLLQLKP